MAGRHKGAQKTGGRQKGTPNKITSDLKTMVLNALHKAGGEAYLTEQAQKNPSAFLTLVGKVLPHQISGPDNGPMPMEYSLSPELRAMLRAVYGDRIGADRK